MLRMFSLFQKMERFIIYQKEKQSKAKYPPDYHGREGFVYL